MLQELSAFFYTVILTGGIGQCGRPGQGLLGIKVLAGYATVLYLIGIIVLVPVEDGEVGVVGQGRKRVPRHIDGQAQAVDHIYFVVYLYEVAVVQATVILFKQKRSAHVEHAVQSRIAFEIIGRSEEHTSEL